MAAIGLSVREASHCPCCLAQLPRPSESMSHFSFATDIPSRCDPDQVPGQRSIDSQHPQPTNTLISSLSNSVKMPLLPADAPLPSIPVVLRRQASDQ